jgi:hypothetical protein
MLNNKCHSVRTCILLARPPLPAFWILGTFYGCNFPSERKTKIWTMCSFPETVQFPISYALKHSNIIFRVLNIVSEAWRSLEKYTLNCWKLLHLQQIHCSVCLSIIRLQFIIYLANSAVKRGCGCSLDVDKNISLLNVKNIKMRRNCFT